MGEEEPKLPGFQGTRTSPNSEIEYDELKELLETNKIWLLDVRNRDEVLNYGRYPYANAINIPSTEFADSMLLNEANFRAKYGNRKPLVTDEIAIACKTGRRAAVAYQTAKEFGYKKLRLYSGSFNDWISRCGPHSRMMDCDQCRADCIPPIEPLGPGPCPLSQDCKKYQAWRG